MKKNLLVGLLQTAGGTTGDQVLSLLRNIVIARIVGPENFGIGLTFALIVAFLESAADLSWDKFVIQDRQGQDPSLMATVHLFLVVRGGILALALFAFAEWIAIALGAPPAIAWAYQVLAVVPLFRSLQHLDAKRFQRELGFKAEVASLLSGAIVSLAVGVAVAWWLQDYRAMLYALVARYLTSSLMTHLFAERRYQLGFAPGIALRAWIFGWPLMINGVVLFFATHGNRAAVSRWLGVENLGIYGAAAITTLAAGDILIATIRNLGLPLLARNQADPARFTENFWRIGVAVCASALTITVGFYALLHEILPFIYGTKFEVPRLVLYWLTVVVALRLFRQWANTALLAVGASRTIMWSNVVRTVGLGLAVAFLVLGGDLIDVAAAQVVGETISTLYIFARLSDRYRLDRASLTVVFGTVIAVNAICFAFYYTIDARNYVLWLAAHTAVLTAGFAALFALLPETRNTIRYFLNRS